MKKLWLSIILLVIITMLSSCVTKPSEHYVYWLNDDGTLNDKIAVKNGEHPIHGTPTSKKTNRIGYHYEFTYWISQNGEVYTDDYLMPDEDVIFTPFYKEKNNTYTVTWKDEVSEFSRLLHRC